MSSPKTLCQAVLLASIVALAPLSSAQASPWRETGNLPSVEKPGLLSWVRILERLLERAWSKAGVSIDPDGSGDVIPSGPPAAPAPVEGPDHGMSIDPNGGQ